MATTVLSVPQEYGYVLLAATSTCLMGILHGVNTSRLRKPANVKYPNAYASTKEAEDSPAAFAFNCAQRSHANFIENQPAAVTAMLIGGLRFPLATAVLGASWVVGRYLYMIGYQSPSWGANCTGRVRGYVISLLSQIGLIGVAVSAGLGVAGIY